MGRYRSTLVALAAVVAVACDDRGRVLPLIEEDDGRAKATLEWLPPPTDERYLWRLVPVREVHTVEPGGGEIRVYDPTILLPLANGDFLVHDDISEGRLVILSAMAGEVRARFGRSGQGPGELGPSVHLSESADGTLMVVDRVNRQLHRFQTDGTWLGSESIPIEGGGGRVFDHPTERGFLVGVYQETDNAWHRSVRHWGVDSGAGDVVVRLPEPDPDAETGRIQGGRPMWALVGGSIVSMWSSRPRLYIHTATGSPELEVDLPWTDRTITERDVQDQAERDGAFAGALRPGRAALTNEIYPVTDSVFGLFQSALWRPREDPPLAAGERVLRLFTLGGEYLGAVDLPDGFRPLGTHDGRMWVRLLDAEGLPVLTEVRLERAGDV